MEFLVILVGFIALFLALNARKGVASLQLQLNSLLTRLSRLEDALDDLRRHPQAPPSAAPVPEAPVAVAPGAAGRGRDAPTRAAVCHRSAFGA
jgi:hypothetical protein